MRPKNNNKICKVCKVPLTKDNSYVNASMLLCKFHYVEYYRPYRRKQSRIRDKTEKGKKYLRELAYRMMKKYPEKYKARSKLRYEVKMGRIKKLPCEKCGEKKVEGHHPDYSKPLEVIWLCRNHHLEVHNRLFK